MPGRDRRKNARLSSLVWVYWLIRLLCQYLMWSLLLPQPAESPILLSVQHDSEAKMADKRQAPESAEKIRGLSVGALHLSMIEEETTGEDGDHEEETPNEDGDHEK